MPFSGLAPSKLKNCSTKIKSRLCVYRGIVFNMGYGGGAYNTPPPHMDNWSGKADERVKLNGRFITSEKIYYSIIASE